MVVETSQSTVVQASRELTKTFNTEYCVQDVNHFHRDNDTAHFVINTSTFSEMQKVNSSFNAAILRNLNLVEHVWNVFNLKIRIIQEDRFGRMKISQTHQILILNKFFHRDTFILQNQDKILINSQIYVRVLVRILIVNIILISINYICYLSGNDAANEKAAGQDNGSRVGGPHIFF